MVIVEFHPEHRFLSSGFPIRLFFSEKKAIQNPQTTKVSFPCVCLEQSACHHQVEQDRLWFAIRIGRVQTRVAFMEHHRSCRILKKKRFENSTPFRYISRIIGKKSFRDRSASTSSETKHEKSIQRLGFQEISAPV